MSNPHALSEAQDDAEVFEVMQSPPPTFNLLRDKPLSAGTRKLRKQVHRDGDWHCSAHVWLLDAERKLIVVQKRSASKDTFPNRWDISAAGHIEVGCDPLTTAVRELAEELGIDNIEQEAFQFGFICPAEQKGWGGCNAYEHVYFVHVDSDNCQMKVGGAEVTDVKWIGIAELEQKLRQRDEEFVPRVDAYMETFFGYLKNNL
jgi:isopentenyldiphosphate isomerase